MAALGGASAAGVGAVVLGLVLVPVVLIDIEHLLIPDVLVLPATALAAIVSAAADPGRWWVPIAWGLGAGGLLGAMSIVSPRGIGLGDAKLCLLLGVTLGAAVVHALVVAFALGGLVGVVLLARNGAAARTIALPFGPFLAVGAIVALAWDPSQPLWL